MQESQKQSTFLPAFLAASLFVAAYFPVFKILVEKWSNSEEYSHAFLTIPIIVYMIWEKRVTFKNEKPRFTSLGFCFVLIASACYVFALLTQVPTFISLAFYSTVLGIFVYLAGVQAIGSLFTPLVLLLLLIPVPDQLYIKLTFPLQLKVSQLSEMVVGMFGVPIFREGNIMNIPGKSFEVVGACSGMRSIVTLLTLSIIIGYFMLKKSLLKIILLLTSIPIAIVVNILRVSAMILLYYFFHLDLSEGLLHTITGLLVFVVAFLLLLAVHKVLEFCEAR